MSRRKILVIENNEKDVEYARRVFSSGPYVDRFDADVIRFHDPTWELGVLPEKLSPEMEEIRKQVQDRKFVYEGVISDMYIPTWPPCIEDSEIGGFLTAVQINLNVPVSIAAKVRNAEYRNFERACEYLEWRWETEP